MASTALADHTVALCRQLLRIDTSNPGRAERPAAERVAEALSDAGLDPRIHELEPGRANVVARLEGDGTHDGALVVHGHLDVVPAVAEDWTVPPFSGELRDGHLWGRGAVDMKDMVAMMTAVACDLARTGSRPKRDLVFAYFADEEAGTGVGSPYMVEAHADAFEGATAAIGEVGGFSVRVAPDVHLYPVQVAEKGAAAVTLRAQGRAGHSSMPDPDSAVVRLAETVARLGRTPAPLHVTPALQALLDELAAVLPGPPAGGTGPEGAGGPEAAVEGLGSLTTWARPTFRNTFCPTMLSAGVKRNVIPSAAEATLSVRTLPGHEATWRAELEALLGPGVTYEVEKEFPAVSAPWAHPLVEAIGAALRAEDPRARPVPFMIPAATDAKSLDRLGITCYGFVPLLLDPSFDLAAMYHGVDERVPVDALAFGARTLHRLLSEY